MSRIEKVNQLVKREISNILRSELQDPRFQFVSVTHVEVSRDLRHARVSVSVLGDSKKGKDVLESLNKVRGYIRKLIGQRIRIRYTPEIEFIYDKSIEYSAKIEEKLEEIRNESKEDQ